MQSWRRATESLFTTSDLIYFLIGLVLINLLVNAVYDLLTMPFANQTFVRWVILAGAVLILIGLVLYKMQRNAQERHSVKQNVHNAPARRRGLILMLGGKGFKLGMKAIAFHRADETLKKCWLIHTTQTEMHVTDLKTHFPEVDIEPVLISTEDANAPLRIKARIDAIYQTLPEGWTADDVIADYGGLTSSCSVGMVLACLTGDRPLQYTPSVYDANQKPVGYLDPVELHLRWSDLAVPLPEAASSTIPLP